MADWAARSAAARARATVRAPGCEPVSDVHEPRARHVAGQPGLVVADVARPRDVVDGEAVPLGSGDGLMGCAEGYGRSSPRAPCPPARRRAAHRSAPPPPHPGTPRGSPRAIGTFTSSTGRTHSPWLRPNAWPRGGPLDEGHRETSEASSNAHAAPITPPPTMTTSGMSRSLLVARSTAPVESTTETCLSGRKEPPAKRLTL